LKCKLYLLKEGKDLDCSLLIKRTEYKAARSLKTLSEEVLEASIQDLFSVSLYQCPSISPFMFVSRWVGCKEQCLPKSRSNLAAYRHRSGVWTELWGDPECLHKVPISHGTQKAETIREQERKRKLRGKVYKARVEKYFKVH
jgi:hypothetical protein